MIGKTDLEVQIETLTDELNQSKEVANQIEEAWTSLTNEIPELQDILG